MKKENSRCLVTDCYGDHMRRLRQILSLMKEDGRQAHDQISIQTCEFGLGVFAARDLLKGERILRFSGARLSFHEAVAKGELQCYTLQVDSSQYVDLDLPGALVNHSCEPNAGVRHLDLIALQNIVIGEEIRFDYSTTMDEDYWEMECRCGSLSCRKWVRDFKCLPRNLRDTYIHQGIVADFAIQSARRAGVRRVAS